MTALASLVVAEHDNSSIKPATLNTVTAKPPPRPPPKSPA